MCRPFHSVRPSRSIRYAFVLCPVRDCVGLRDCVIWVLGVLGCVYRIVGLALLSFRVPPLSLMSENRSETPDPDGSFGALGLSERNYNQRAQGLGSWCNENCGTICNLEQPGKQSGTYPFGLRHRCLLLRLRRPPRQIQIRIRNTEILRSWHQSLHHTEYEYGIRNTEPHPICESHN
jgi:hypothetical protein